MKVRERGLFDVSFIQWLQQFSSPVLDRFFLMVTDIGSHYAYMAIIPFIYWAVDRQVGRRLAGLFLTSMWLNGLLKEYLVMPRPDATAVRVLADEPSPGFPSGHAQGAMTLWGYLAVALRRRWLTWLAVVIIALVSLSRLYLGVHFPGDVLGGLGIAAVLLVLFALLYQLDLGAMLSVRMRMLLIFLIPLLLYPLYQTGTSEQLIGFFIGFFTAETLAGQVVPFPRPCRLHSANHQAHHRLCGLCCSHRPAYDVRSRRSAGGARIQPDRHLDFHGSAGALPPAGLVGRTLDDAR